jgi:hypothetical protein
MPVQKHARNDDGPAARRQFLGHRAPRRWTSGEPVQQDDGAAPASTAIDARAQRRRDVRFGGVTRPQKS